jgi:hypothetical protein
VACLFVGLMLVARVTRRLGITQAPAREDTVSRPVGGRRASH